MHLRGRRVARESLLSMSLSHPNVVSTYKICTIRVGESSGNSKDSAEPAEGHRPPPLQVPEAQSAEEETGGVTALLEARPHRPSTLSPEVKSPDVC